MSNELVPYQAGVQAVNGMDPVSLGKTLAASGYFKDVRDAAQAAVKVMYGAELGIGPISSMMGVYIIEGKPAYSANIMAAAIKRSGRYNYRIRRLDKDGCEIEYFEGRESIGVSTFSRQDATEAGLSNKPIWKTYARNMLFARAMSNGFRWYCPDLTGGAPAYTPEELGVPVDAEGTPLTSVGGVSAPPERPQPRPAPPDDETPQPPDQDAARRAFYGACDRRGLCERNNVVETRARVNGALGLPPIEGVLPAVAAEHGWDALRRHIEDATELPSDVLDRYWAEAMQEHPTEAPDDLAQQWSDELAAVAVAEPEGAVSRRGAHS